MPDTPERKAVVVHSPKPAKAIVIGEPPGERRARARARARVRVWLPPVLGDPTPESALAFVVKYREFANLTPTYGFMARDLRRMSQVARIAPVRFVYELRTRTAKENRGHWMLYLREVSPEQLRVYDPTVGVKDLTKQEGVHSFQDSMFNNPASEAKWGPERIEAGTGITVGKITIGNTIKRDLLNAPAEAAYQIDETLVERLGKLQRNAYDCGPLCVYAAMVARKIPQQT